MDYALINLDLSGLLYGILLISAFISMFLVVIAGMIVSGTVSIIKKACRKIEQSTDRCWPITLRILCALMWSTPWLAFTYLLTSEHIAWAGFTGGVAALIVLLSLRCRTTASMAGAMLIAAFVSSVAILLLRILLPELEPQGLVIIGLFLLGVHLSFAADRLGSSDRHVFLTGLSGIIYLVVSVSLAMHLWILMPVWVIGLPALVTIIGLYRFSLQNCLEHGI